MASYFAVDSANCCPSKEGSSFGKEAYQFLAATALLRFQVEEVEPTEIKKKQVVNKTDQSLKIFLKLTGIIGCGGFCINGGCC